MVCTCKYQHKMSFIVTQYRYKDIVGYGKVVCVCAEQHYYRP